MNSYTKKSVSVFLWIPLIWYAIVATRNISYWFPGNIIGTGFSYIEGSPFDRVIYSVLIVIGVIILIYKRIAWLNVFRHNKWIFAILIYAMVSVLWSDFPQVAAKRWIKLFGSMIMSLIVLTEPVPVEAISTLLRRCLFIHIPLDIILVKYFRNIGVGWDDRGVEMWMGLTTHKNVLGEVCMIGGLYFIWDIFKKVSKNRIVIDIFYLAMIVYLMNGGGYSRSASAILALIVGLIVLFSLPSTPITPLLLNRFFIKGAIVLVFAIVTIQLGVSVYTDDRATTEVALGATGRDSTLTGRTDLWEDLLKYASKNPITGVGYGSFWIGNRTHNLWDKYFWKPQQGHNGYIDVYLELGIIGLFLLGGFLISTFNNIKEIIIEDFEFGRFKMALFFIIVIHNITETSYLRGDNDIWFIFLLMAWIVPASVFKRQTILANP